MAESYCPQDTLSLWLLSNPVTPRRIGELMLVMSGQGVGLRYDPDWLTEGFALSEDLPLTGELFLPQDKQTAAGAVDDARPDRWGERIIRKFERTQRLSLLEFLLFAGGDRYGALGVSTCLHNYQPWNTSPLPALADLSTMQDVVRRVLNNEPVGELEKRLLRPGVSLGGARPKSLIELDGQPWLVKFDEGEEENTPLIEHAAMTLAAQCGIVVAPTRALPVGGRHAVAVQRFDRAGGRRLHVVSAHVAMSAAGEHYGYPQLAQQLRRLCSASAIKTQQEQLFRRMVFNIFIDNTDDHEKNHALVRQADGSWLLAPAFDIVPSLSGLRYQAMIVGREGTASTLDNALSSASAFGLSQAQAKAIADDISLVARRWRTHFQAAGVARSDLEMVGQYLSI